MLLCFAFFGVARADTVEIGDGGTTNNSYLPGYNYYNYSLTQQIYTADEIGMAGTINSIAFKNTGAEKTRTYNVYMLLTDKETFTGVTDWIAMSDDDLVFAGELTFAVGEWTTIQLETPFAYDGSSNLLVGVSDVTGNYSNSPHMACLVFDATSQAIRSYRDTGAYDITNPNVSGTVLNVKNQIQLDITPSGVAVCTKPTLAVSNITDVEATLTCGSGSGTYNVQYKAVSATDWNEVAMNTTETTFTLTGLTGLTAYEARAQSVCEDGTSDWKTTEFATTATAEPVGEAWSDDFEGNACGWELINGELTNAWVWGTAANNGGAYGLYISNDGGTTNAYTVNSAAMVYAAKLLSFTEGKFDFSYNWMANGENTWDFLRVALVPASVTLTAGTTLPPGLSTTTVPTGWIALDGGGKLNLNTTWQAVNVAVDVTAGNYYLVMAWRNDTSGGTQPPAAIDNVSITKVACDYEVTDLAVSGITTTGATLSWDGGEATQWQVAYGTVSNFENATEEIVDDAAYDMTGLQANTTYYVRARAYCGGNDFGAWTSMQFKTECAASTEYPFTENFDSYTGVTSGATNNLPDCWNYINGTTYSYYAGYPVIYNNGSYSNSGNNHLRLYSYAHYNDGNTTTYDPRDQYAILPPMENLNGKQLTLFAIGANTNSTFRVGMMTDPYDASTFVEIATTTPTTSYAEYTYLLTGTGNYLAIMMEAANPTATSRTVYIDDITIDFPPTCPKPTSLTYADVTAHEVTLSWTENGEADAWQICLNDDEENLIDVTENPCSLTGLAEETAFAVKVRANCGGNNGVSEWSNVVSFTTPQACPAPTRLTVSDITGHHATLNWNGSSDSYHVMYRTKATADGLYEDFSTSPNWERYTGLLESVLNGSIELTSSTSYWTYSNENSVFDRHARINIFGSSVKNWLVTPIVEVAENYILSFDLALTKYSGNLQPVVDSLQQDDKFVVLITTDDGSNWTILRQWDNAESEYVFNNIACAATGEHVSFDLSEYIGQNVRIAFYGESTNPSDMANTSGDNNLHIDNVIIGIPIPAGEWQVYASDTTTYTITGLDPETDYEVMVESSCPEEISHASSIISFTTDVACLAPTGLAATEITPNSIELTWTDNNEATTWQLQVNEEDPIEVTTIPYVVENLESITTYTLKVRANCGDEGYSEWSNTIDVTTLEACPVPTGVVVSDITHNSATVTWTGYNASYTLMIAEGDTGLLADFETGDLSQADFTTTDDFPWTVVEDANTGAHYAKSYAGGHSETSALELEVTLDVESILTFSAKISSESSWDKGYFSIDETYQINGISGNGDWINYSYALPVGTHTLGWYYIKDSSVSSNDDCFYVDDIAIISFASGEEYTTTAQTYTFNNLTPETPYQVKVKGVCGDTETEWSEPVAFTTTPAYETFYKEILGYGDSEKDHYYLIALPIDGGEEGVSVTTIDGMITDAFDLYYFDESQEDEWINYNPNMFNLVSGKGYLYASREATTLTFTGRPIEGTEYEVKMNVTEDAQWAGWNLVGNPFAETAYIRDGYEFYTLNEDGNKLIPSTSSAIQAMEGVFVVAEQEQQPLTFTTDAPGKTRKSLVLNLTKDNGLIDRAIVRFDQGRTLPKFQLRERDTKVYVPVNGEDYAVVNAEEMGEMPFNFKAEKNGSYSLSFNTEEVSFDYLHLIDHLTGADIDLLVNPNYRFEAKTTDYASRFKLVFATGDVSDDSDRFAFVSNGELILTGEGTLQVFDALGRQLLSKELSTANCQLSTAHFPTGVYLLQLIKGDDVKTQKMVIP